MSIAKLSNGTLLQIGDGIGSLEDFTTVPEVMKLRGPSTKFDLLDVSSHDTPTLYREYIPGMADGDVIQADINWRPNNAIHQAVREDAEEANLRTFRVVYPDTGENTVEVSTYVTTVEPEANVGEQFKESLRIKVTGAPSWS